MLTRTFEKTLLRLSTLALTGYLLLMPGIVKSEEAKKEEPRKENIFAQGAFDTAVLDGNLPKDWWPNDKDKVTLEQEGKDRFLRITNDKPDATVYAVCRIPVKPEWKRLSISTRLAGKNLKVGVGKDPRAHLLVSFENAKKEWIGGGAYGIRLTEDSEWKPMGGMLTVPPEAAYIALRPGLYAFTGELGIDDISMVVEEQAAQN